MAEWKDANDAYEKHLKSNKMKYKIADKVQITACGCKSMVGRTGVVFDVFPNYVDIKLNHTGEIYGFDYDCINKQTGNNPTKGD